MAGQPSDGTGCVWEGVRQGLGLASWAWVQRLGGVVLRQVPLTHQEGGRAVAALQSWLSSRRRWPQPDPLLTVVPSPPGYSLVTHIPAGARDIQIVERKKSADVLGV